MSAALASTLNAVVPLAANDNFTTQSRSFDYDNVGRLTGADGPLKCMEGTASYSYDAARNLHSKSFMENGAPSRTVTNRYDTVKNRVTTTEDDGPNGDRALHYDSHGNVYKLGTMRPCRGLLRVCSVPRTEYLATPTRFKVYDRTDQPAAIYGRAANGERTVGDYIYDGNPGTFALRPLLKVLETVQAKPDFRESLNANGPERVKSIVNGEVIYNVYDAAGSLVHVDIRPRPDGNGGTIPGSKTDYIPGPLPWPSAPILCPPDIKFGCANRLRSARIKTDDAGTSTVTYMHDDHLKSASLATKGDGTIAWAESYTPYGETLLNPAANDNQGGFTGHIKDKATGLNYMQARYYDPNIGRFLSVDPVTFMDTGNPGMFNRYAYTLNDPVNLIDPDGECPICIPIVIFIIKEIAAEAASRATGGATDFLSVRRSGTKVAAAAGEKATKIAQAAKAKSKADKTCCFVAGTLVETEFGLRPIEEIKLGDRVLARDPETGETSLKAVTDLIRLNERVIWEVSLSGESDTSEFFETTDDHPWWIVDETGQGSWKNTAELSVGMIVTTADNLTMKITTVSETGRTDATYNLTVADFETYFVGKNKVLVHNCGDTTAKTTRAALRNAKAKNGVPRSAQPDKTIKSGTPEGDAIGLDSRNVKQMEFTNGKGEKISIRHDKPTGPNKGNQPEHFNAGPSGEKLRQHHNVE